MINKKGKTSGNLVVNDKGEIVNIKPLDVNELNLLYYVILNNLSKNKKIKLKSL